MKAVGFDETAEQTQAYGMALIAECVQRGITRVLCDERDLEYRLSTIDTYAVATAVVSHAPRVARVAIVCNPASVEDAQFWENVAVNRGLTVKVFKEMDAARQWLGAGGQPWTS